MLKIFYQLDELDSSEHNLVADAANRLEVGEFQVFQLGYFAWYGNEPPIKLIERSFFGYMLQNEIPHWARHYARRIIQMDEDGVLSPYAPEYHRYDRTYKPRRSPKPAAGRGLLKFLAIGLAVALAFVALVLATGRMVPAGVHCFFPPCHWQEPAPPERYAP